MDALAGERVTLRALRIDFFDAYQKVFSHTVQQLLHVSSIPGELEYLQHQINQHKAGNSFFYCMFTKNDNALIGAIAIRDVQCGAGLLYNWVNELYWGQGYYQEALALFVRYYFTVTHTTHFQAYVDMENKRSYYALKKFGFADSGMRNGPFGWQYELLLRNVLWTPLRIC